MNRRKWLTIVLLASLVAAVSGCRTLSFYQQAISGQFEIVAHQKPIEKLVGDPSTPAPLKEKLRFIQQLHAFAREDLKLPANGHYQRYVDVHRRYVVWNVQAAPEFSLEPKTWWYPFVGRLEYRGYFAEQDARSYARAVAAKGYDVFVDGVEAYSTLGWFKDPVLNTFIHHDEAELAEILFHELGHQRLFASGDTDFNEAFATTVGQEGTRRWLRGRGDTNAYAGYAASVRRNDQFAHLVLAARDRLEKLYGDRRERGGKIRAAKQPPLPADQLRREKQRVLAELRSDYGQLKAQWGGDGAYDNWFTLELNNARLNTIANYYDFVPGFERLLEMNGGDLEKFYQASERLSKMSKAERHLRLRELVGEEMGRP